LSPSIAVFEVNQLRSTEYWKTDSKQKHQQIANWHEAPSVGLWDCFRQKIGLSGADESSSAESGRDPPYYKRPAGFRKNFRAQFCMMRVHCSRKAGPCKARGMRGSLAELAVTFQSLARNYGQILRRF